MLRYWIKNERGYDGLRDKFAAKNLNLSFKMEVV